MTSKWLTFILADLALAFHVAGLGITAYAWKVIIVETAMCLGWTWYETGQLLLVRSAHHLGDSLARESATSWIPGGLDSWPMGELTSDSSAGWRIYGGSVGGRWEDSL